MYVDNDYNLLPLSMQVSFKGNFLGQHKGIITTDTPSQHGQSIDVHNGKLGVEVQNGFYSSDIEVSNDTWYNATAVFTDGNVKLYIDGVLEASRTSAIGYFNETVTPIFSTRNNNSTSNGSYFHVGYCEAWNG